MSADDQNFVAESSSPTVVCAERLTARYPGQPTASPALIDVSLEVQTGERLLLVGPNGAGKSTLIRVFAGLMRPSSGKAVVAGIPARLARGRVGVVSHTTFLYDELTVSENLRLYAELYGAPAARTGCLLQRVAMSHLADMQVGRLSRGQQQRIAIARALLHDPPVLLLDEPDTGLDVAAFALLEDLLVGSHHTVILTTHNLVAGLRLATRAAVLAHGSLIEERASLSTRDAASLGDLLERLARG